jgi:hypothetical protein
MRKIAFCTQAVLAAALVCWSGGAFEQGVESRQNGGRQNEVAQIVNALQGAGPVGGRHPWTTDRRAEISPLQNALPLFGEASSQEAGPFQGAGRLLGIGPLQGVGPFRGVGPLQGAVPLIAGGALTAVPPIFILPQLAEGQASLFLAALPPGVGNAPQLPWDLPVVTPGSSPTSMTPPSTSVPTSQTAGPASSTPDYGPTPASPPVTTPNIPWGPTPPYFAVPPVNTSACARAGSCT